LFRPKGRLSPQISGNGKQLPHCIASFLLKYAKTIRLQIGIQVSMRNGIGNGIGNDAFQEGKMSCWIAALVFRID